MDIMQSELKIRVVSPPEYFQLPSSSYPNSKVRGVARNTSFRALLQKPLSFSPPLRMNITHGSIKVDGGGDFARLHGTDWDDKATSQDEDCLFENLL